jgi:diguanylate cyclase (GGDEF) domain
MSGGSGGGEIRMRRATSSVRLDARLRERLIESQSGVGRGGSEFDDLAAAYLRLEDRLEKIIAIGDKYQAEALEARGRLKDALERLESLGSEERKGERERRPEPVQRGALRPTRTGDPLASRIRAEVAAGRAVTTEDVAALLARCEKLNSRMEKIVTISDRYQGQLREASAQMEYMARTDPLTSLSNRRDMVERIDRETDRFERYGTVFSVILFDIDDFKRVNDRFGHDAGDRVLKAVSHAFLDETRRCDSCSRWGGEEFLILCPQTDAAEALVVAEKCREAVADLCVEHRDGTIKATVSGGIASIAPGLARDALINKADEGLYLAKSAGKNTLR